MYVPLLVGETVTGVITIANLDRENAFGDSDVRLLETLAGSMSVALENARLFDETQRLLKEEQQRAAELAIINSVQEGLASKLDYAGHLSTLVGRQDPEIFEADTTYIGIFDAARTATCHFPFYVRNGASGISHEHPAAGTGTYVRTSSRSREPLHRRHNGEATSRPAARRSAYAWTDAGPQRVLPGSADLCWASRSRA